MSDKHIYIPFAFEVDPALMETVEQPTFDDAPGVVYWRRDDNGQWVQCGREIWGFVFMMKAGDHDNDA